MSRLVLASVSLATREVRRFLRQRSRVVGALGTPIVFWLLLGSGMGSSFRAAGTVGGGEGFLEYFFPGALALTVLFASIYSTISIIQDRQQGFLQGVLVSPAPRLAIVIGKVGGGTVLALMQGAIFLALAPLAGVPLTPLGALLTLGWLAVLSVGLTGLGFFFAWRMDSVQGYHGVMNLLLMPMWMLSGAVFPISGAHGWLRPAMLANPLTYGVAGVRHALYLGQGSSASGPSMPVCLAATIGFAVLTLTASRWTLGRSRVR